MSPSPDRIRAALLLTNRLVGLDAKPLPSSEFWALAGRVDPGELLHLDAAGIAERAGVDGEQAQRLRALLDADTAMSFEQERMEDGGVSLLSALDEHVLGQLAPQHGDGARPAGALPPDIFRRAGCSAVLIP